MLSTAQALAGLFLAAAGTLALDPAAAMVTPAPTCGGNNPCADQVSAVPACATGCIESAASGIGCVYGDYGCQCSQSDAIQETAILCVVNACGLDSPAVIDAVGNLCACVTASPTSSCTDQPASTTSTEPPVITEPPTCGGNPCSDFVSAVPACATGCIESAASEVGCAQGDYGCQCISSDAIQETAILCVVNGCQMDAPNVLTAVANMCSCVTASPVTPCTVSSSTTNTVDVSSTTPEPPISESATTSPTATITTPPECPHPCAASISAVPSCATACITSAASAVGCTQGDYGCQCGNSDAIQGQAVNCVVGACGFGGALDVVGSVGALCSCVTASPATACEATATSATGGGDSTETGASTTFSGVETSTTSSEAETSTDCSEAETSTTYSEAETSTACSEAETSTGDGEGSFPPTTTPTGTTTASVPDSTCTDEPEPSTTATGGEGSVPPSSEPTATEAPCPSESESGAGPSGFETETRTVEITTSICDDESGTMPPVPSCTAGCGGGDDGGDNSGDDGGDGDEGGDASGSSPSSQPSGGSGGGSGSGSIGSGGSTANPTKPPAGASTTTPKPPVVTAGASNMVLVGTRCLACIVAAVIAFI